MNDTSCDTGRDTYSKVPELILVFWIIKILATTLGETGGDAVSMSMDLGYLVSTAIFALLFIGAVFVQIKAPKFHPIIYWPRLLPRQPWAQRWLTSPRDPSVSVTRVALPCCWHFWPVPCSYGSVPWGSWR